MKKKWIACLLVIVCALSVCLTCAYYRLASKPTNEAFAGTYQFHSNTFGQNVDVTSVDYLAIAYLQDQEKGEFTLYNSQTGVIKKGECQREGDFLFLNAEYEQYLIFLSSKKYYFITESMQPELLDKVSNQAVE